VRLSTIDDAAPDATSEAEVDLSALDEALKRLAEFDPQQAGIVELRFFGGLTLEETAELCGLSVATVKRDWTLAKAWLHRELQDGGAA
jgi:RNA polymerase sigma factor (TIGR02999 family)